MARSLFSAHGTDPGPSDRKKAHTRTSIMAKFIYSEIKSETNETGVESPGHKPVPASTFSLYPILLINKFPQPQIFNRSSSPFTSSNLQRYGGLPYLQNIQNVTQLQYKHWGGNPLRHQLMSLPGLNLPNCPKACESAAQLSSWARRGHLAPKCL